MPTKTYKGYSRIYDTLYEEALKYYSIPYSAKVKTPLNGEGLQTFGHYGTPR